MRSAHSLTQPIRPRLGNVAQHAGRLLMNNLLRLWFGGMSKIEAQLRGLCAEPEFGPPTGLLVPFGQLSLYSSLVDSMWKTIRASL